MKLAAAVTFLNEERYLPAVLASIAGQTCPPAQLLLVDDGSTDGSSGIAHDFASSHPWAEVLTLPAKPAARDRLVSAPELRAFSEAQGRIDSAADVVAKLDADILFSPRAFEALMAEFERDETLGVAGAFLSFERDGQLVRERKPPDHVRGATKFYRRQCFDAIFPLPAILGWDTIDEAKARLAGWKVQSFSIPEADPVHLRPTGSHDGQLRGFARHGLCAWNYGAHPLALVLGAMYRIPERPPVLGSLAYLGGWSRAAFRRLPRAEPAVREEVRREQLARIRREVRLRLRPQRSE